MHVQISGHIQGTHLLAAHEISSTAPCTDIGVSSFTLLGYMLLANLSPSHPLLLSLNINPHSDARAANTPNPHPNRNPQHLNPILTLGG